MQRRQFEDFSCKPSRVWTLEVDGVTIRTAEGLSGSKLVSVVAISSSPEDAVRKSEQLVLDKLAGGFQEVHLFHALSANVEPTVKRTDTVLWRSGYADAYTRVHQDDRMLVTDTGHLFRGGHESLDRRERWFRTISDTSAAYDEQLTIARGQTPTARQPPTGSPVVPEGPLAAACDLSGESSSFIVLADHLMARGDPRGEIAALSLAGESAQARALIEQCFAPLWQYGVDLRFSLVNGFVTGVKLVLSERGDTVPVAIRDVLQSPLSEYVNSVTIDASSSKLDRRRLDWEAVADAIVESGEHRISRLEITDNDSSSRQHGNLAALQPVLEGGLPGLRRLGLTGNWWDGDHVTTLAAAPQLAGLEALDVSNGSWSPKALTVLVRRADQFRHLASFKLLRSEVESDAKRNAQRLQRALPLATVELWNDCP